MLAERGRGKALAASSVKIHGFDVVASFKIVYGFITLLLLSVLACVCIFSYNLYFYSAAVAVWDILLFVMIWPVYLFISMQMASKCSDHFSKLYVNALNILLPYEIERLRKNRNELKKKIGEVVETYGPIVYPGLKTNELFRHNSSANLDVEDYDDSILLSQIGL